MDSLVLTPLNNIEEHLDALLTSLTHTNTFANAPQIAKDLLADDDELTSALSLLQRHQQNYARILSLREEVASLKDQLKGTIRQCVTFKQEIGQINPSILDAESDSEDEEGNDQEGGTVAEVDYHTLLTFAARIGRHNTIAAKEAEADALRRKIAAKNASTTPAVNGVQALNPAGDDITAQDATIHADANENNTAETTAELTRIDAAIALQRAQMGMSFPDSACLRTGALGQLQLFAERQRSHFSSGVAREDEAETSVNEALEREVGRMVRESEDVADEEKAEEEEVASFLESPVERRATTAIPGRQTSTGQAQRPPSKPTKQKQPLNLDFPGSDDSDDD